MCSPGPDPAEAGKAAAPASQGGWPGAGSGLSSRLPRSLKEPKLEVSPSPWPGAAGCPPNPLARGADANDPGSAR